MKGQEFRYRILDDPDKRQRIIGRGQELIDYVKNGGYETLIFLDRSARPIAWLFTAMWQNHFLYHPKPNLLFLDVGRKDLRKQYMEGIGEADSEIGHKFVGIYDNEENITLFKQKVRSDERTKQQLAAELGNYWMRRVANKQVLIVDDCEFEGVSRLFAEEIIDEIFSPKSVAYFEFAEDSITDLPHGLSEEEFNPSFVAKPSKDPQVISNARTLRKELSHLAREYTV